MCNVHTWWQRCRSKLIILNSEVILLALLSLVLNSSWFCSHGPARFPGSCQDIHVTSSGDKLLYQLLFIKSGQKSVHHYCITRIINVVQLVFLHVQEKKAWKEAMQWVCVKINQISLVCWIWMSFDDDTQYTWSSRHIWVILVDSTRRYVYFQQLGFLQS